MCVVARAKLVQDREVELLSTRKMSEVISVQNMSDVAVESREFQIFVHMAVRMPSFLIQEQPAKVQQCAAYAR